MLTLGIDDAGRGPIIGPMILAGVLLNSEQEKKLKAEKVRDSKIVLANERTRLAILIKNNSLAHNIQTTQARDIDDSLLSGTNLNTLEAIKTANIINEINNSKMRKERIRVVVDCPSVNITAWQNTLIGYIKHIDNLDIRCEHKADANHVSVSAASLLAKFTREEEVAKIKKEFSKFGDVGSGYPSDPITKIFLKKHGRELENSGIFRKTWATWKNLFPTKGQATLDGFS